MTTTKRVIFAAALALFGAWVGLTLSPSSVRPQARRRQKLQPRRKTSWPRLMMPSVAKSCLISTTKRNASAGRIYRRARRPAAGRPRRAGAGPLCAAAQPARQSARPRSDPHRAGRRRARHQLAAHRRARPAARAVRRQRRGQERAARHDGALHQRRPGGGRADRRTRPRGARVRRDDPRARGPGALGGGGGAGRQPAADAPARRLLCHRHRRVLPRPGQARAADHGLAHPLRHGPARDQPGHRRAARHQGLHARRCSPSCRSWSSAPATGRRSAARSPPSTPCWSRATTCRIRSPTRRVPSSTVTSCSRAIWPTRATIRRSTSRPPSAGR